MIRFVAPRRAFFKTAKQIALALIISRVKLPAQQPLQPTDAVSSIERVLTRRSLRRDAEWKLAQGGPVFRELHPSGTIGGVGGGFRLSHALLRSLLAFTDAFHRHSPRPRPQQNDDTDDVNFTSAWLDRKPKSEPEANPQPPPTGAGGRSNAFVDMRLRDYECRSRVYVTRWSGVNNAVSCGYLRTTPPNILTLTSNDTAARCRTDSRRRVAPDGG